MFFPHSVVSAFWCRKCFNFDIINLSILLIHSLWSYIIAMKSVPSSKPWIFTPMIPSKTLLMFRSLIHLALTFCVWCEVGVQLHSFPDGTPVSRHCIDSFPCLGIGVEIQLTVQATVDFWAVYLAALYTCLSASPYCCNYYSFAIGLEPETVAPPTFFFLCQDCFAVQGALKCHINSGRSVCFCGNCPWGLVGMLLICRLCLEPCHPWCLPVHMQRLATRSSAS